MQLWLAGGCSSSEKMIVGEREKIIVIKCRKCTIRCMDLINPIVLSNGPPVRDLIGPSP